jgi:hypothetical protein
MLFSLVVISEKTHFLRVPFQGFDSEKSLAYSELGSFSTIYVTVVSTWLHGVSSASEILAADFSGSPNSSWVIYVKIRQDRLLPNIYTLSIYDHL